MNMQLIHYRNYWMWINKITLPVFSVRACSNCWLQYQLIFWKPVTYYGINIASLSQDCITKVPDQHCTEQYQEPIINKYIWYINIYIYHDYIPSPFQSSFSCCNCHLIYLQQCPRFPHLKNNQVGFHLLPLCLMGL